MTHIINEDQQPYIIHTDYETERAEANELLANDSKLFINEFETATRKWFELGKVSQRKAGFLAILYLRTTFISTTEITNPKGPSPC